VSVRAMHEHVLEEVYRCKKSILNWCWNPLRARFSYFSVLDKKTDDNYIELKEDINLVKVKLSGLSDRVDTVETNLVKRIDAVDSRLDKVEISLTKRIDAVDEKLTKRIDAVHTELIAHRESVELHKVPRKRVLKQV